MKTFFVSCSLFVVLCQRAVVAENPASTDAVVISPRLIDALAEEARTNHPALRAGDARADAATWNAAAVRAWEDPVAKFGVMGAGRAKRADDGDLVYGVEQKLPLFGKPQAARAVAQAEAQTQRHEAAFRVLQARRDLVKQLLRVALAERLLELGRDDVASLDTLATTTEDKYRNGFATQVELLQTQNEHARRANLLRTDTSLLRAEQASLNRFLGRNTGSEWPRLILPPPVATLPPVDELVRHAAATAPQLDVLRASVRQSESSVALARKQRLPDVSVGLEGRQFADTGEFREGMVTVGVSIPWGNRSRYAADVRREQRKADAAQLDIADLQLTLRDEITRLAIQIENAQREAELYRGEIIPRTRQALDSARANWLNNRGALRDVLEARRLLIESQATEARALAEQQSMLADLSLHCGLNDSNFSHSPAQSTNAPAKGNNP